MCKLNRRCGPIRPRPGPRPPACTGKGCSQETVVMNPEHCSGRDCWEIAEVGPSVEIGPDGGIEVGPEQGHHEIDGPEPCTGEGCSVEQVGPSYETGRPEECTGEGCSLEEEPDYSGPNVGPDEGPPPACTGDGCEGFEGRRRISPPQGCADGGCKSRSFRTLTNVPGIAIQVPEAGKFPERNMMVAHPLDPVFSVKEGVFAQPSQISEYAPDAEKVKEAFIPRYLNKSIKVLSLSVEFMGTKGKL